MSSNDVPIEPSRRWSSDSQSSVPRQPQARSFHGAPALLSFLPGLLAVADWCGIVVTGHFANALVVHGGGPTPAIHPLALVLAATLTVNFIYLFGGYSRCAFRGISLLRTACSGWAASVISFALIIALLGYGQESIGLTAQLWLAAGLLNLLLARVVVVWRSAQWHRQGRLLPKIAVLGANHEAADLVARLRSTQQANVVGLFLEGEPPKNVGSIAGTTDDLVSLAAAGAVDQIVLTSSWPSPNCLHRTIARFAGFQTMITIEPELPPLKVAPLEFDFIGGVAIMTIQRRPLSDWGAVAKRLEDVIISLLALVLLAPLLLIVAILIKLDSPGPVLFRQERYGFNNNRFLIYKFRTMRHESVEDRLVPQARRNDPRITRVGAFLRRSSLDELPQLLNVLWGDMSLVGARPHAAAHNEKYAQLIDGYLARHRMKPGITGWAQVNGARGGTETPLQMQRRLEYDLYYISNWSLYLDLKVLLMTVPAVLRGTNAY